MKYALQFQRNVSNINRYAVPSPEENSDRFIQGKFLAWSVDFFFSSKWQLSIFFNFHFSFVHFVDAFYWEDGRFVEFASILPRKLNFLACTYGQMIGGWLTNMSAHFTFAML